MATHKLLEIESALKKNEVRYNLRWEPLRVRRHGRAD